MTRAVHVVTPGLQTTVQDYPGRVGYWRVGIPPSGPMDSLAFRLANLLVGNVAGAPALEIQLLGPTLRFTADATVAVTGGECAPRIDDDALPMWVSARVRAGQTIRLGQVRPGARAYLAIAGGIAKERVLGSAATFPRGGIGGGALAAGDVLDLGPPAAGTLRRVRAGLLPDYPPESTIEVTRGPHFDWLGTAGHEAFLEEPWKVSAQSDRTGIRLIGPQVAFSRRALDKAPENGPAPTNVINTGYPIGGVNLCGDTPIILPIDGPSQGGFITPFVVASAALWKVGQLRPHQTLRFRLVSIETAIRLRRELDLWASAESLEETASRS